MTNTANRTPRFNRAFAVLLALLLIAFNGNTQIISQFDFNVNPVTKAAVGPNATSVSANAISSTGGAGGTNGLNPVSGDILLTIASPSSAVFDVPGLDISIDFKRKESIASFYTRGSNIDFGMNNGSLFAKFLVSDGGTGSVLINSGNIYTMLSDNLFHRYRMVYSNQQGRLIMYVDGTIVYSYQGTANRALYNTGAGSVVIGKDMDGTNGNAPVLDNFVAAVPSTVLPVTLINFTGLRHGKNVSLNWQTAYERDFSRFVVERSADAIHFTELSTVSARGVDNAVTSYSLEDTHPLTGRSYYRLKLMAVDGHFTYSSIVALEMPTNATVTVFPIPAHDRINIELHSTTYGKYQFSLLDYSGHVLKSAIQSVQPGAGAIPFDLPNDLKKGTYLLRILNTATGAIDVVKVSVF